MPIEPDRPVRHIRLGVAVQIEPIQGQLVDDRGVTRPFIGWLELVELIERQRADQPERKSGP